MKISMTLRSEKVLSIALTALFGVLIISRLLAWNGWADMLAAATLFILCLILLLRSFGWYEISGRGVSECTWLSRKQLSWNGLAFAAEEEDNYRGFPLKRFVFSMLPKAKVKRRFLFLPNRRVICMSFIMSTEKGGEQYEQAKRAFYRNCPAELILDRNG